MMTTLSLCVCLLPLVVLPWIPNADAQQTAPLATVQLDTFNSTFELSSAQVAEADIAVSDIKSFNTIIEFDQTQYAGGSANEDVFYNIPEPINTIDLQPGTILKVEDVTSLTNYSLQPNIALSRISYVSLTLNKTIVPTSAFVLWPFSPRHLNGDGGTSNSAAPVVLWSHPTAGFFPPSAPSKHRTLFAGPEAPFALAAAGYAVIAPDFAGLGVSRNFSGEPIVHQYMAAPAGAMDALYGLAAARKAWSSRLTGEFVVFGFSQGGGVAWAIAELAAQKPELARGYLGTVAGSPTTSLFGGPADFVAPFVSFGLTSVFLTFKAETWLTEFGAARARVLKEIQGGLSTAMSWFGAGKPIARQEFASTWEARAYNKLAFPGRKEIRGPMLVLQGTDDVFVPYNVTRKTLEDTCAMFPQNQIEFLVSNGTHHIPTLYSTRERWMKWIDDRFDQKDIAATRCGHRVDLENFLPIESYQAFGNSFTQWAGARQFSYEVPLSM